MRRTTLAVNASLIERVMRLYGLATKREAADFALRVAIEGFDRRSMLDLGGSGWEGELDLIRGHRPKN